MNGHLPFTLNNKLQYWLFFFLIISLPSQFGKHFWPDFAFVFGQRIDYYSPTIYISDILSILFIFFAFLRKQISLSVQTVLVLGLLFLILSLGIFFSRSPIEGWYQLVKLGEFILLGVAIKKYLDSIQSLDVLLLPLSFGVVSESILALLQFINQSSIGGIFYFFGERTFTGDTPGIANASLHGQLVLRPYGTFSHPNVLAAYIVIALFVLVFYSLKGQLLWWKKYFIGVTILLGTVTVFVSLSRVAIVLWFGIVALIVLNVIRKKLHMLSIIIVLGLTVGIVVSLILLLYFIFPQIIERFFTLSLTNEAVTDRFALSKAAMMMIAKHPLLGVGLGNFISELPYLLHQQRVSLLLQPVHNILLLTTAETGLLGFGLVMYFFVISFRQFIRHQRWITLLFFAIAFLFGQFDHYLLTLQQGQLLFTLVFSVCWTMLL